MLQLRNKLVQQLTEQIKLLNLVKPLLNLNTPVTTMLEYWSSHCINVIVDKCSSGAGSREMTIENKLWEEEHVYHETFHQHYQILTEKSNVIKCSLKNTVFFKS